VPASDALSVVLVTHDSIDDLPETLAALAPQLRDDDDVVVVDTASSDDPEAVLQAMLPRARLIRLRENAGFAGGAIVGAAHSVAPLLLFLNPDARTQPGCLDELRAAAAARPEWGAWQALVTLPGGALINTSGGVVHWLGFAWAGECDAPVAGHAQQLRDVGFASGAALCVRRDAWEAVGGFEPAYFMYCEDVDLSLRLRIAGWGVGVAEAARVEHAYSFTKGDYKWFHLERNRWWTLLGAYPAPLLALVAPALLAFELALLPVAAAGGWWRAKVRAQAAVIRTLPWALRRRSAIQAQRRVAPSAFASGLSATLDSAYLGRAAEVPGALAVQRAYWWLVRAVLRRR
jgi:GT2 family glycosyltransferase